MLSRSWMKCWDEALLYGGTREAGWGGWGRRKGHGDQAEVLHLHSAIQRFCSSGTPMVEEEQGESEEFIHLR